MIVVTISMEDYASTGLAAFGKDAASGMLDASLRYTARGYKRYVERSYLSGQMLHRRTGRLIKDLHYGKTRGRKHDFLISSNPRLANIYGHPGGADIKPSKGKVLRWARTGVSSEFGKIWHFAKYVHLAERPFMTASAQSFDFSGEFQRQAAVQIQKTIERNKLDG
jgi:hypothetical protein